MRSMMMFGFINLISGFLCSSSWTLAFADPPITAGAFSADMNALVLGSQSGLEIRSWPKLELIDSLNSELQFIHDIVFSSDGSTLIASGGSPAESGGIEVWDWRKRVRVKLIPLHDEVIYRVSVSPEGNWITASADSTCKVVDSRTHQLLRNYDGHSRSVLALATLPHSSLCVSAGVDQTVRVWDRSNANHLRTLDNHTGTVNAVAVKHVPSDSPRAQAQEPNRTPWRPLIATVSEDRTVRIWEPSIGRMIRFARLTSVPRTVVWSWDGNRILVGCDDGQLHALDANSLDVLQSRTTTVGRVHELLLVAHSSEVVALGTNGYEVRTFE